MNTIRVKVFVLWLSIGVWSTKQWPHSSRKSVPLLLAPGDCQWLLSYVWDLISTSTVHGGNLSGLSLCNHVHVVITAVSSYEQLFCDVQKAYPRLMGSANWTHWFFKGNRPQSWVGRQSGMNLSAAGGRGGYAQITWNSQKLIKRRKKICCRNVKKVFLDTFLWISSTA